MKAIRKKLLGVFACMLMLTMIPFAAGMQETSPARESVSVSSEMADTQPDSEPAGLGRVWLRGILFRCNRRGDVNHALAIRLHYAEITPFERTAGIVTMNRVTFGDSAYAGRMYEIGFGMFTYVIGFFKGGLEIN